MSMTVFVVVEGKGREAIKVTPMRQLGAVVEEVLGKTKRNITKEEFTLTKMKKVLDMADTVRLAGVVDRDTIHLDRIDGGSSSSARQRPAPKAKRRANDSADRVAQARPGGSRGDTHPTSEAVDRSPIIFKIDSIATSSSSDAGELPDEFYDFTASDYEAVMKSAKTGKSPGFLMTQALRDREEEAKASKLPPVRIRVVFPDRTVLQALFSATEDVSSLYTYVAGCIASDLAFHLFTAPPKRVIDKNSKRSLYGAGLVPSAKIYFGLAGGNAGTARASSPGSFLRKEWIEQHMVESADVVRSHGRDQEKADEGVCNIVKNQTESSPSRGAEQSRQTQPEQKSGLPKWMKLRK